MSYNEICSVGCVAVQDPYLSFNIFPKKVSHTIKHDNYCDNKVFLIILNNNDNKVSHIILHDNDNKVSHIILHDNDNKVSHIILHDNDNKHFFEKF